MFDNGPVKNVFLLLFLKNESDFQPEISAILLDDILFVFSPARVIKFLTKEVIDIS
jgi:hypothetical protein